MPIYEYQCTNCNQQFDLMQKISDPPATQCPRCFKNTAVRLVSAAGFQLKGSGWYATDFKNKTNNKSNDAKSSEAKKDDKKAETKVSSDTSSNKE